MAWRTVPASSLRSVIDVSARIVPTDVVVGRYCRAFATAMVTDSMGSGWLAAAASAFRTEARFQATRPPAVTASATSRTADPVQPRLLIRGLRIRGVSFCSEKSLATGSPTRRLAELEMDTQLTHGLITRT